ncbi:MFS transporter [Shimia ponticola]|uniref:MFS transporter n=1 Tax=Shimia ponticola TaxID=2582893 RepID=UPI0011BFAEDD|nr:MFS transporter [Shimia ponticola]
MLQVLNSAWALLLGMMLLMVGNGLQGTLLGVRGEIEGFSTLQMSVVMSAYFAGFLVSSRMTPELIRRVGHIRVFAALGSLVSATLITFPVLTDPISWTLGRVVIGFCFCGLYVTAESWLNNATTTENRGKALSMYMIVQMSGVVAAQGLLVLGDPSGYILFVIPSILVSLAFTPILLSVSPTPPFDSTKPMSLKELYRTSPLGCVGMFLLGGVFSAQFGMAAVFATQIGLSVGEISTFIATIYVGALVLQFPIGFVSDRIDRRILILACAAIGGAAALYYFLFGGSFYTLLVVGFIVGGTSNPLYALLLAYTNDYIEYEDMPAASGGLLFINGVGAIAGPLITGYVMGALGPNGFFLFIASLMLGLAAYAMFRMTQRAPAFADDDYEATTYAPILPTASPVALEVAQEVYIETDQEIAEEVGASG